MAKKKAKKKPETYWNHRVFVEQTPEGPYLSIKEVHYKRDIPYGYCDAYLGAENLVNLYDLCRWVVGAFERPVLGFENGRFYEVRSGKGNKWLPKSKP